MIIDHIGILVKSIEKGIEHWEKLFGYKQFTEVVTNSRQKVNVVFLKKANSITVKLIEPLDESSNLFKSALRGGGLHHLCFKCDNLEHNLNTLQALGLRILEQPQPGEAFDNEKIAFVYAGNGLNIELIDTDKRAQIISDFQDFGIS